MTREAKGELLTAVAWLLGWSSLTVFAAALFGVVVVFLSAGLLLIGVAGVRPLGLVLWHGLHFLPRDGGE